ncbi:MAG: hypothetical protein ABIW80_13630 [Lapillicoccus sp.]
MPVSRWVRWVGAVVVALALAGCSVGAPDQTVTTEATSPGPVLGWAPVALPDGLEARTLTTLGDRLLVGALRAGDPPAPAMVTVDAAGAATSVPLTPASPYGSEARWYSVATDGARVIAIGGANGGAHANVRWTTWAGTAAGVVELPQSFYTFGGWGAGDLVEAVVTPSGDALVGSWGGARAGLDTAVWTFADRTWTRQDPGGTALESTPDLLAGPRGATVDGPGLLVTGSALHLTPGPLRQTAALWRSPGVNTAWRRVDLPDAGTHSEAVSAHCPSPDAVCVVAGQVDGALALWRLDGERAQRLNGIPRLAVGDQDPVPAPLVAGSTSLVVSPSGAGTTVLTGAPLGGDGPWRTSAGPGGRPLAAAMVGDRLYVATRQQPGGPTSLWSARWTG